ncbi:hypothetical protein GALMADRAFT_767888 [Galerina marginata CBS 339.88]|uniref:Uncharacterized protein n=1 Tax=Galerina marginata (strain CBS 339.88) TaxID=685588 RepID=A0A067SMX7_GALM3|nr:hypothetical protein GALMADRAFT_767888 [Galerina marginata CBS 339.88]
MPCFWIVMLMICISLLFPDATYLGYLRFHTISFSSGLKLCLVCSWKSVMSTSPPTTSLFRLR